MMSAGSQKMAALGDSMRREIFEMVAANPPLSETSRGVCRSRAPQFLNIFVCSKKLDSSTIRRLARATCTTSIWRASLHFATILMRFGKEP